MKNITPNTFIKTYHHVMLDTDKRMTKHMKEVYNFLLSYDETATITQIFPSTAKIAQFTCNSPATVKRATKALQEIGLIKKVQRYNSSSLFQVMPYSSKDQTAHTEPSNSITNSLAEVDSSERYNQQLTQSHETAHTELSDGSHRATIRTINKTIEEQLLDKCLDENQSQKLSRIDGIHLENDSIASEEIDITLEGGTKIRDDDEFSQIMSDEDYFDSDEDDADEYQPKGLDDYRDIFKSGLNKVKSIKKRYNPSQSYRSSPNY